MGSAQDLFDKATESYDKAINRIKMLDRVYQEAHKEANSRFKGWDVKVTLAQFDWILQGILMSAALIDGDFHRLERQFVEKITDYGDLLKYIKKKTDGELDLSWDDIARLDSDVQKKLLSILPTMLEESCDSFVAPLAEVDRAVDSRDFLDELTNDIAEIGYDLCSVDGSAEKREAEAIAVMARELLFKRWNSLVNR